MFIDFTSSKQFITYEKITWGSVSVTHIPESAFETVL